MEEIIKRDYIEHFGHNGIGKAHSINTKSSIIDSIFNVQNQITAGEREDRLNGPFYCGMNVEMIVFQGLKEYYYN